MENTPANPDQAAQNIASATPPPVLAQRLIAILGPRLVAYIGGVKDSRTVEAWSRGQSDMSRAAARRVQLAYACALALSDRYDHSGITAWFTWLNDMLDDTSPAAFLSGAESDEELDRTGVRLFQSVRRELVG
jgi:hypothetical protein